MNSGAQGAEFHGREHGGSDDPDYDALAAVLDITGLAGAVLTAFEVYLIKHDAAAVASGSAHRKWTMTAGSRGSRALRPPTACRAGG